LRLAAFPGSLACLVIATLLIASGRSDGQQPGDEADPVRDACASVVLVRCGPPQARSGEADSIVYSEEDARRRLQSRRLQRMQAQAGLNAIEITGERPAQVKPDAWENFRQSVAGAAVPDCFSRDAFPPEQWGLLRPLVLLGAAAAGKCR
jgi:hypothetical protein